MRALRALRDRAAVLAALNADRGAMLVMNGSDDSVMDMAHHPPEWFAAVRERTIALRGTETNIFITIVFPGISHRTSWVTRKGMEWLENQIHSAVWTETAIANAPLTHISEWAKRNDIDIARSYLREDREGGLEAVGEGFPGVKRLDLMVLPEQEWLTLKDKLTYESWAAKTVEAEKATLTLHPGTR